MAGRRWWMRRWLWALVAVLALVAIWVPMANRARPEARRAVVKDARVDVSFDKGVIAFTPMSYRSALPVGLLIFPEASVDPIAYAPFARAIAAAGYPVILAPLSAGRLPMTIDVPATLQIALGAIHEDPRAAQWVLSGHGRGASIAARVALEMLNFGATSVGGILLIGSVQPHDSVLMHVKVPVAKIVGSADGRARLSTAEANRRFLPPQAKWTTIAGGNHSQFTSAGWLPGDWFASISRDEQQQQLVNTTLEMLRSASETQRGAGWLAK